jgi:hypothetical protein
METETDKCPICCEDKTIDVSHLTCTHWFHKDCIKQHIKTRLLVKRDIECPVCRNIEFKNGTYDYKTLESSLAKVHNETTPRSNHVMNIPQNEFPIHLDIRESCMSETNINNKTQVKRTISIIFKIFIAFIILSVIFALLYNLDKLP